MTEMIAYCGLDCFECGAYQATQADDDDQRRTVAATWSKEYDAEIEPQDINCLGCLSDGEVLFHHCEVCEIRQCGQKKDLLNCAYCDDFACSALTDFFVFVPEAEARLVALRSSG